MSLNEKVMWEAFLYPFGLTLLFVSGLAIGSGWGEGYAIGFFTLLVITGSMFVAWTFRMTFLAGKRRGDT